MRRINLSIHQLLAFADGKVFNGGKRTAKTKRCELPLEGPNGESCDQRSGGRSRNAPAYPGFEALIVSTYRFVFRRPCFRYQVPGFLCRAGNQAEGVLVFSIRETSIRLEDRGCKIGISEELVRQRSKLCRSFVPTLDFRQKSEADVAPGNGARTGTFYAQLTCLPFLLLLSRKGLASYGPNTGSTPSSFFVVNSSCMQ